MLRKHQIIKLDNFKSAFDKSEAKKLMSFSAMAITSALTVPISHMVVRDYIGATLSWDDAGYWQAIWYISTIYLMVVTTALGVYYLPKLSEITEKTVLRKEILQGYKVIMPIVILLSLTIFLLKDVIIWILFSEQFIPMRELFLWQLIGDVIKMASWLISYLMLAKAMTKVFVITEILFSLSFVFLSIEFVSNFGLEGVTYAFTLNSFIYFLTMLWITKKELY